MTNKKILVLYSGKGTNAWNLIDKISQENFPADICGVIKGNYKNRENDLIAKIVEFDPDIICLAGYMHLLSSKVLYQITPHVLNIHPSYLPQYKGLNTHKKVLEDGCTNTGATVHLVNEELDAGRIIHQIHVGIYDNDTVETLKERVLRAEHQIYPEALKRYILEMNHKVA